MAVVSAATEAIFGCEPRELSLLYTLFYIAASGNEQNPGTFERNFNTAGGAQETRFVGGAQTVPLRVASQLGKRVVLSAPVRRIEQTSSGVTVVSDAVTATGKRVIVAIPPTLAGRIHYEPALPPLRDQLTQHMPQGTLMKFEAIYDTPFWRDEGPLGPGRERERPGQGHLRHLAARRQPRDHDGLHRRTRGARVGRTALRTSAAPPRCRTSPTTSATRRSTRARSSSSTGRPRYGTAAVRSRCSARAR